jgi:prepilin-type N-terminal cleavage/methylation domain-containing protein
MRRAFTLIELLVVVAIIGLLIALFLPALAASRRTARATVGFANLRSLSQVMTTYLGEYREGFLNPFRPAWPDIPWTTIRSITNPDQKWDFNSPLCPPTTTEGFATVWYSYMAEYRGGRRNDMEQVSPGDGALVAQYRGLESDQAVREGETLMPTSFVYPPVFWSRPNRFFHCRDDMTPPYLETQVLASVVHPSAKVMLFERGDFASERTALSWNDRRAKTHIALVDGSCDTVVMRDLIAAAAASPDLIPTETCCPPVLPDQPLGFFWATFMGVQGRDISR